MRNKINNFVVNFDQDKAKKMLLVLLAVFIFAFTLVFQLACEEIKKMSQDRNPVDPELEREISDMVKGYPIESMVPLIAQKDKAVAAFLIGIAKKESGWGKHAPVKNGKDCYNYWGFKKETKSMGSGGHTCFRDPGQAVDTVSARISELIFEEKKDTPKEMAIWKCGSACTYDKQVGKWISDVNLYYKKLIN
jgi:hypothetical protein